MAQDIPVEMLGLGDFFYEPRYLERGLRKVAETPRRLHVGGENFVIIMALRAHDGGSDLVETHYLVGVTRVARVAEVDYPRVAQVVSLLRNGQRITFWRGPDGKLYS